MRNFMKKLLVITVVTIVVGTLTSMFAAATLEEMEQQRQSSDAKVAASKEEDKIEVSEILSNIRFRSRVGNFGENIPYSWSEVPVIVFFIIVFSALIIGLIMSLLYKSVTKKGQMASRNFAITLVMLPTVIAAVVFVVGENMAAAFSLAGVFSMTRFRSSSGNAKDITFIFVSVATGLACGLGAVFFGLGMALILCVVLLVLDAIGYGEAKNTAKILRINIPESLSYDEVFDPVLKKYADSWDISRVKTIDLGATFELTYQIAIKDGVNEKNFIDELRTRNANMNIILRVDDTSNKGI